MGRSIIVPPGMSVLSPKRKISSYYPVAKPKSNDVDGCAGMLFCRELVACFCSSREAAVVYPFSH